MLDLKDAFTAPEYQPFLFQGTNGHAILLVHGFGGTPGEVRLLGQALHTAGYTVQAILLNGFGNAITTLERYTQSDWIEQIEQHYQELKKTHENVMLLGFSMGGALSVQVAKKVNPRLLFLVNPFWKLDNVLWALLPMIKLVVKEFKPFQITKVDFNDPKTLKNLLGYFPHADFNDPQVQKEIMGFSLPISAFTNLKTIGEYGYKNTPFITVPTLVLQGKQDEVVVPMLTREYLKQFKNSPQYKEIEGTHNLLEDEQHIPTVADSMLKFIKLHLG
jgi:carboxylesterase